MNFHLYGFIVGLAIIVGYLLAEKKLVDNKIEEKTFTWNFLFVFIAGVIGARLWHVATDFYLYKNNLIESLYIWNGGLSILGAIFTGLLALLFLVKDKKDLKIYLDSIVFALPISQAIGRWANFVNQELYGLPTSLPWKIFINFKNRFPKFESFEYYHPLFFYESIMALLGFGVIFILEKKKIWKIGDGKFIIFYLGYYGVVRFFLDFLRINRGNIWYGLGTNQWIILSLETFFLIWTFINENKTKKT